MTTATATVTATVPLSLGSVLGSAQEWLVTHPPPVPPFTFVLGCSIAYLALVLSGAGYMRSKQPIKNPGLFALHNLILCVFSGTSALLLAVALVASGYRSVLDTCCDSKDLFFTGLSGWVNFLFLLSKIYEFADTAFLVMQKSRLRFLHVYHHASTLLLAWLVYADRWGVSFYFAWFNMIVHTPMYWYYFVAARGGSCWWKKYLTTIQIVQFVVCMGLVAYDAVSQLVFAKCPNSANYPTRSLVVSVFCYISFLALFIKLYRENYLSGKKPRTPTPNGDPAKKAN